MNTLDNFYCFIGFTLLNLVLALVCFKGGKRTLESYIVVATLSLYCMGGKLFDLLGVPVSVGAVTYAGIFLASDMLTEYYGKKSGYRVIRRSLFCALMFIGITQFSLLFKPMESTLALSNAMDVVFGASVRIFAASITAYFIAQHFDVWLYHYIHEKTKTRFLWLRNNASTWISQFIDTVIFGVIAFYGVVPNLIELILAGYIIKVLIALLDTPFIYMSRQITPFDKRD